MTPCTETHVPKLDDWGDYLYIAIHAIRYDRGTENPLTTHELDAFLGKQLPRHPPR